MVKLDSEEVRVLSAIANGMNTTVRLKQLQNIMEYTGGNTISRGKLLDIKATLLCPGVYRIELVGEKK